jgi:hypothetical protein
MSIFGLSDGNRPASAEDDLLQKGDKEALYFASQFDIFQKP